MTNARRIRALVVDDEPLAREMIREMLGDDPDVEIVAECANGRDAVDSIKSLKPDLVFLDVQSARVARSGGHSLRNLRYCLRSICRAGL